MATLLELLREDYPFGLGSRLPVIYAGSNLPTVTPYMPNWTYGSGNVTGLPTAYRGGLPSVSESEVYENQTILEDIHEGAEDDNNRLAKTVGLSHAHISAPNLSVSKITGNQGWLQYQTPYLTIINKKPIVAEDLNKYIGLPLMAKRALSTLSGYTEISELFLPQGGIKVTQEEENEIRSLLNGGVIF